MSLIEIKKRIAQEAASQAKQINDSALKERQIILKEAEKNADSISANAKLELDQELKRIEQEHDANMELLVKRIFLDAREESLKKEVDSIKRELEKSIKADASLYKSIFSGAMKEATGIAPLRELTIQINKNDAKLLSANGAHIEYGKVENGLIVISQSKEIRIDATLKTIVDSKDEIVKSAILAKMFGEGERKSAPRKIEKSIRKKASKKNKSKKARKKG